MFQKIAKHRANDASNDVHRPPLPKVAQSGPKWPKVVQSGPDPQRELGWPKVAQSGQKFRPPIIALKILKVHFFWDTLYIFLTSAKGHSSP